MPTTCSRSSNSFRLAKVHVFGHAYGDRVTSSAPPAIGHALRRKYGSRITVREPANAGHAMIIERPDTVARKMLAVLAEHPISR